MKVETVRCMACQHLRVLQGTPICGHCDRPVTPGNMTASREYLSAHNACKMAVTLQVATGEELLKVEPILHGYV
ncbi:MAG: hypothetical protein HOE48_02870 [Candidatus Latescibacteria bacterium]|jgi:hypothetical protein|nr:hypothetical protein [Candidatus Latescibacterota bacterium]